MERFKKRFGLKFRRVHVEAMSADQSAIARDMSRIESINMTYVPRNVWNSDEACLFHRQLPMCTPSNGPVSGFKNNRTRINLLAWCSNNRSESMPFIIIFWGPGVEATPVQGQFGIRTRIRLICERESLDDESAVLQLS